MVGVGWYFPVLSGGGEEGYTSNDIEAFKGEDLYANLARETCQNSLDARASESDEPVVVRFELRKMEVGAFDFFRQYGDYINSCEQYWRSREDEVPERLEALFSRAHNALESGCIDVLVVSDYNTPGLLGSENVTGSFNALVYAEGVSHKQSDTSAGSFGIGRNAPFACSALSCVCYNTKAVDGGEAFAGVAKLATALNGEGKRTRRQGRYQYNDDDNEVWRPIRPSDNDAFARSFCREEYGTDIIILGFEAAEDWRKQLECAVLKSFFLAIQQNKLIVEIQNTVINSETISGVLQKYETDSDMRLTCQYYKTIVAPDSIHRRLSIASEGDADLYIRTNAEIDSLKSVAWFRSSGMLIRSYKPQGIFRPYVAVFIANGNLDRILRATEPARHNDWDYKRIEGGRAKRSEAKRAIDSLKREIKLQLKEACETIVDDTIDAVGAANYLPDNADGNPEEGGGTDAMRPLVRIGRARRPPAGSPTEAIPGTLSIGSKKAGEVGNRRTNPNSIDDSVPNPYVEEPGGDLGATAGDGTKTIRRPIAGKRRIYGLVPEQGMYRLVVIPDTSACRVYATCSALGENGSRDLLKVKSVMLDGKKIGISKDGEAFGPFDVNKGERLAFTVIFQDRGPMALAVDLRPEGEQS